MNLSDRFRMLQDEARIVASADPTLMFSNQQQPQAYSYQQPQQSSIDIQLAQLAQLQALQQQHIAQPRFTPQYHQPQYVHPQIQYSQPLQSPQLISPYQQQAPVKPAEQRFMIPSSSKYQQAVTTVKDSRQQFKKTKSNVFINPQALKKISSSPVKQVKGVSLFEERQAKFEKAPAVKARQTAQERLGRTVIERLGKQAGGVKLSKVVGDRLGGTRTIGAMTATKAPSARPVSILDRLGRSATGSRPVQQQPQQPSINNRLGKTIQDRLGKTIDERIGRTLTERLGTQKQPARPAMQTPTKRALTSKPVEKKPVAKVKKVDKIVLSLDTLNLDLDKFMWEDERVASGKLDNEITEYMKELERGDGFL